MKLGQTFGFGRNTFAALSALPPVLSAFAQFAPAVYCGEYRLHLLLLPLCRPSKRMQSSSYFTFVVLLGLTVSLASTEIIQKGKLAKHGMLKENKPNCLLTRSRLGCACTTCKEVVSFTRMLILNHVPDEEVVLDKVCFRIFGEDKKKESFCEELIKEELPDIIKYVRDHVEPKQVCAKFC